MSAIIDKLKASDSPYLIPMLSPFHKTEQQKIDRIHKKRGHVNMALKDIGSAIGVEGITTYSSRHTYATFLKQSGGTTGIISQALGHTSESTTQANLDSFSSEAVDRANELLP